MMEEEKQGTTSWVASEASDQTTTLRDSVLYQNRSTERDSVPNHNRSTQENPKARRKRKKAETLSNESPRIGQEIEGTIEGVFDAGYMLAAKVENTDVVLRGVLFDPKLALRISNQDQTVAPNVSGPCGQMQRMTPIQIGSSQNHMRDYHQNDNESFSENPSLNVMLHQTHSKHPEFSTSGIPSQMGISGASSSNNISASQQNVRPFASGQTHSSNASMSRKAGTLSSPSQQQEFMSRYLMPSMPESTQVSGARSQGPVQIPMRFNNSIQYQPGNTYLPALFHMQQNKCLDASGSVQNCLRPYDANLGPCDSTPTMLHRPSYPTPYRNPQQNMLMSVPASTTLNVNGSGHPFGTNMFRQEGIPSLSVAVAPPQHYCGSNSTRPHTQPPLVPLSQSQQAHRNNSTDTNASETESGSDETALINPQPDTSQLRMGSFPSSSANVSATGMSQDHHSQGEAKPHFNTQGLMQFQRQSEPQPQLRPQPHSQESLLSDDVQKKAGKETAREEHPMLPLNVVGEENSFLISNSITRTAEASTFPSSSYHMLSPGSRGAPKSKPWHRHPSFRSNAKSDQ